MLISIRQLVPTFVWVFCIYACHIPGTCKVGHEGGCPKGTYCEDGKGREPGNEGICVQGEALLLCEAGDEACPPSVYCEAGETGACRPLSHPLLTGAQFSSDCRFVELLGSPGIQPPATYASSLGSIDTLCPGGVRGEEAGFRCALSTSPTNLFAPGRHVAHWTVESSMGDVSTSPAYVFQTAFANTEYLMERAMPSAILGYDAMEGRQLLSPAIGNPHAWGGCWGGVGLRGSIAAGEYYACAVHSDSTVRCWGTNTDGQTNVPDDLGPVVAVAAGYRHTCALQAEGTVRCWGASTNGQTNVPGNLGPVVAVAAGYGHTCALQAEGTVRCWGASSYGQTNVPGNLDPVVAVAAGHGHTCALQAEGTVRCWGAGSNGQTNVPDDLGPAVAVAAGSSHSCALQADGRVRCWGGTSQVGPREGLSAMAISAVENRTCALQAEGTVRCWGNLGDEQANVPANLHAVAIAVGYWYACALEVDGTVRCWGNASVGQSIGSVEAAVQHLGQLVVAP
ncbi:MAG: hypothetical protein FWC28_01130 [Proteobacteria bacterium]|nr:hypothetical protein [Cystobacterineae bacterium]MCL2259633.1 hypothetical protein [Cystobacterineae bacterium]MCL2313843.1 hypothetical protein [Pseudomonadota bacterium]